MQLDWHRTYPAPRRFFPERRTASEYLDRESTGAAEKERSYRDLETVSRLPGHFRPLERALSRLLRATVSAPSPLRLVEVGAGSGQVGLRLARAFARRGYRVELVSTDIRPEHIRLDAGPRDLRIETRRVDVLRDPVPGGDLVLANLLLHHFSNDDACAVLGKLWRAGRLGGAVFDLDRNAWAFHAARIVLPLLARSPVTVADGLISIQQAFRRDELLGLARRAGVERPAWRRYLGIRSLLSWRRETPPISSPGSSASTTSMP